MKRPFLFSLLTLLLLVLPLYISSGLPIINNQFNYGFNRLGTIKVMTYNIRAGRTDDGRINLDELINQIESMDPDILALQEVDYRLPRSYFQNQVEILGSQLKMNYLFVPNVNFVVGAYGNAILSKFPITDFEYHPLPSSVETRGFLRAQVSTGTHNIDVYATHLGLNLSERMEQIASLTMKMSLSTSPKLLLGDFNSKPTEIPIQSLRTVFIDPVYQHKLQINTYEHKFKKMQLDYIFFSKDFLFDTAFTQRSFISDHNPLMYSLILANEKAE